MYDLPELHILALGDMVHGTMLGGKWSPAYFETDVFSQAAVATEAICDMVMDWSQYFKKISLNGVIGNHGRGGISRTSDKSKVNWDNVMYANLKARFAGRDNVSVKMSDCWWQTVDVNGTKVLLLHGEHLSGKVAKLVAEEQALQSILPQDSSKYDVLCVGHVHHSAECETSRGRVFVNGSFVGSDPHGLENLKVYSRPTQTIFGVHPTNKVTWKYNLDLAR